MIKRILLLSLLVIFVTSCGEHASAGIVIGKSHRDAYTSYIPVCTAYYPTVRSPNGVTTGGGCMIWSQIPVNHPEEWILEIQDCRKAIEHGDQPAEAIRSYQPLEHCLRGHIRVGRDWDNWQIGEWYGEGRPATIERVHQPN